MANPNFNPISPNLDFSGQPPMGFAHEENSSDATAHSEELQFRLDPDQLLSRSLLPTSATYEQPQIEQQGYTYHSTYNGGWSDGALQFDPVMSTGQTSNAQAGPSQLQSSSNCTMGDPVAYTWSQPASYSMPAGPSQYSGQQVLHSNWGNVFPEPFERALSASLNPFPQSCSVTSNAQAGPSQFLQSSSNYTMGDPVAYTWSQPASYSMTAGPSQYSGQRVLHSNWGNVFPQPSERALSSNLNLFPQSCSVTSNAQAGPSQFQSSSNSTMGDPVAYTWSQPASYSMPAGSSQYSGQQVLHSNWGNVFPQPSDRALSSNLNLFPQSCSVTSGVQPPLMYNTSHPAAAQPMLSSLTAGPSENPSQQTLVQPPVMYNTSQPAAAHPVLSSSTAGPSENPCQQPLESNESPQCTSEGQSDSSSTPSPSQYSSPQSSEGSQVAEPIIQDLDYELRGYFEANSPPLQLYANFIDTLVGDQVARNALMSGACHSINELTKKLDEVVAQTPLASDAADNLRENAKRTRDTAEKWAEKLQKEYPGKRVQALSFSDMTPKHYLALGVDPSPIPIRKSVAHHRVMDLVLSKVESQKPYRKGNSSKSSEKRKAYAGNSNASPGQVQGFSIDDVVDGFSTSNSLLLKIQEIVSNYADETHAFAKLIIDAFLAEVAKYLAKMGLGVYKIPKLRLASGADPVEVLNGGFLTVLTGSVDYAVLSKPKCNESGSKLTMLRDFWITEKLHGVKEALRMGAGSGIHIFMIEAKEKKYSQSLESCKAQIAAECIAIMKSSGLTAMRWCLSTGSSWLFGVICRERWAKGEYRLYTIETMEYDLNDLDSSVNVSKVQKIFWALMCWSMITVKDIIETVFRDVKCDGC